MSCALKREDYGYQKQNHDSTNARIYVRESIVRTVIEKLPHVRSFPIPRSSFEQHNKPNFLYA